MNRTKEQAPTRTPRNSSRVELIIKHRQRAFADQSRNTGYGFKKQTMVKEEESNLENRRWVLIK